MKLSSLSFQTAFIAIVFSLSSVVWADNLTKTSDTKVLAEKMVNHFIKKEFKEGMSVAKPYWPLPKVELDNLINKIQKQWPIIDKRFGKAVGSELVLEQKIGDSFLRYYYLHKFKNHAIYWKITFYKPETNWVVNGVSFKDKLDILYK